MPADLTPGADDIGAPPIPLCAHHRGVIYQLETKDHIGDADSERVATEMRRQCCGRGLT